MAELTILEPISTGDVIDRAVRLYRRNFIPLISVVAVPALIYYASAMMFSYGYAQTIQNAQSGFNAPAALMAMVGLGGYLVYLFAILGAISGMSRAIGDHVMLGEEITFKRCWRFAVRRLGDVALMGLLFIPVVMMAMFFLGITFFVLFMGVAFVIGLGSAAGLPAWLGAVASVVLVLGSALLFAAIVLLFAARVIFVPDALMIEGRPAMGAFGRAFQLGGGRTWQRLGMIAIFSYFVNLATFFALVEPLLAVFWVNGWAVTDLLLHPGWNAAYAAVNQISALLVWPIWITSLTLLYFDTRVRKEGYDIELMTANLPESAKTYPGGTPAFQPPVLQWGNAAAMSQRPYMQTGPLGLGGYSPPQRTPAGVGVSPGTSPALGSSVAESGPSVAGYGQGSAVSPPAPDIWLRPGHGLNMDSRLGVEEARAEAVRPPRISPAAPADSGQPGAVRCAVCGLAAPKGAKYCIACGDLLPTEETGSDADRA